MYTVRLNKYVKLEFIKSQTVMYGSLIITGAKLNVCFVIVYNTLRIHGRILRMDFVKDHSFTKENEDLLQLSLKDLVASNKVSNIMYQLLV